MSKCGNCVLTNPFKRYGIRSLIPEHSVLKIQKHHKKCQTNKKLHTQKGLKKRAPSGKNRNFLLVHITKSRVLEWNSKVSKQNPSPNKAKEKSLSYAEYVAATTTHWSTTGTAQRKTARIFWKEGLSHKTRQNIVGLMFGRETVWLPPRKAGTLCCTGTKAFFTIIK